MSIRVIRGNAALTDNSRGQSSSVEVLRGSACLGSLCSIHTGGGIDVGAGPPGPPGPPGLAAVTPA